MSQVKKTIGKLQKKPPPKDFTWEELIKVLNYLGFESLPTGKTGGSRRKFVNNDNIVISLHEPHPQKVLKAYQIEQVLKFLKEEGLL